MTIRVLSGLLCLGLISTLAGCGSGLVAVNGVVTLDGQPVEGATVTFVSEDGKTTFTGFTDASGNFSLAGADPKAGAGAAPGTYKVTVVKSPKREGGEGAEPGGADYMKLMEKEGKDAVKSGSGPAIPMPGSGGPGGKMMMPKGGKGGPGGGDHLKSELPTVYAAATSTPITVKVPPENQPVQISLKKQ